MIAFFKMAHMGGPDSLRRWLQQHTDVTIWRPDQVGVPDFMEVQA